MEKELLIKQLEKDNKEDFECLNVNEEEYEELRVNWYKKELDEFDLVRNIEIKKHVIQDLINNF